MADPQVQPATTQIAIVNQPGHAAPLSKEERDTLISRLRQNRGRSRLEVKGPTDMYPYWARKDDPTEMSRLESLGFRVVIDDLKKPRYQASGRRSDGTFVDGDVILMELPREVYAFLEQENSKTAKSLVRSAKDTFRSEAEKRGVPTFDKEPAGAKEE